MTGAGNLDRRATFQRSVVTRNAMNEPLEVWHDLATVSLQRDDVSAAEAFRAQEVGAQLSTRYKIRANPRLSDLNARDRMIYAGRVYNITGVRESARNQWYEVDTVARDDDAAVDETSP